MLKGVQSRDQELTPNVSGSGRRLAPALPTLCGTHFAFSLSNVRKTPGKLKSSTELLRSEVQFLVCRRISTRPSSPLKPSAELEALTTSSIVSHARSRSVATNALATATNA